MADVIKIIYYTCSNYCKHQTSTAKYIYCCYKLGAMYENCLILSVTSNGLRVLEGEDGWDGLDATINYISSILTYVHNVYYIFYVLSIVVNKRNKV